ncbi:2-deoxystreptamine glucosyltransferase [Rubripirellula lacrimiformis]|uniref:2-deoxystreptamine glucosyltransferase n=1 Tax=Rubripirellula lacrimiformis TaxID=1930273 RepID=A0A517N8F6_9BACT|nr:glycosyltransferase family 4 protein [Rubripirellula lacrimiformis]QDT03412.1 2-deoxystreptamine glucosyltransferase [Rubripirellula lacrimiformis]
MKVVHIVASCALYGKEQVILELMRAHRSAGIDSILGSIRVPGDDPKEVTEVARNEGLATHTFSLKRGLDLRGGRQMAAWLIANDVDVCHIHDYKASVLLGMQRWRCPMPPLVRTLHGFTTTRVISAIAVYEWLDRQSLRFHRSVVGVSDEMRDITPVPITVIRNGIRPMDNHGPVADRSSWSESLKSFVASGTILGTVARLSPEKNQVAIVDAVAALVQRGHDVKLLIVGEGPQREPIEAAIARNQIEDRVMLAGFMKQARGTLTAIDIYLQPSTTEGTPISILEAMDAGVPIGMSRVGAMTGLVDQGVGFAVPLDAASMADSIEAVLLNPDQQAALAAKGKEVFAQVYSADIMADAYVDVYKQAIASN